MFRIFHIIPWIMPPEPSLIQSIFQQYGKVCRLVRGATIAHGDKDNVLLLTKGLVTFSYLDIQDHYQTLALILPKRTIGDLEIFENRACRIIAECLVDSEFLVIPRQQFLTILQQSIELMQAYSMSANRKHQCTMEGMIANYTQPLERRLKLLLYSLITSHYELHTNDWNPCPTHLNITDISKILASNRSWVSRTISAWITEGLIKKDGRRLLVHSCLFDEIIRS